MPTAAPTATPTATPAATPNPSSIPTATEITPPTGLKVDYNSKTHADGSFTLTATVTWTADNQSGSTVKVYGVNKCLGQPNYPCATDGMAIPDSNLLPLASAPAADGTASWDYWAPEGASYYCGAVGVVADTGQVAKKDHWYWAIVLRSEGAEGNSAFTVAAASTNEVVTC
jgi:hypothetical protein